MSGKKQIEVIKASRLATRTVYKLVFVGMYVSGILLGFLDIVLALVGIPQEWLSLQLNVSIAGVSLFAGFLGLILLPITAALWAGMMTLVFGSAMALGLYLWHFLESITLRYVVLDVDNDAEMETAVNEESGSAEGVAE